MEPIEMFETIPPFKLVEMTGIMIAVVCAFPLIWINFPSSWFRKGKDVHRTGAGDKLKPQERKDKMWADWTADPKATKTKREKLLFMSKLQRDEYAELIEYIDANPNDSETTYTEHAELIDTMEAQNTVLLSYDVKEAMEANFDMRKAWMAAYKKLDRIPKNEKDTLRGKKAQEEFDEIQAALDDASDKQVAISKKKLGM
jgi:hypothetical protein